MSEVKFKREERYIVVKIKHLAGLQIAPLRNFLRENRVPTLDCVVVESDWPEYEKVWRSIERRMTGQPAEDFDAQRLRADTAEATVAEREEALALKQRDLIEAQTAVTGWARKHAAAEQRIAELSANNQQLRKLLEQTLAALNPTAKLSKSIRAALNPNPEAESHEKH